jgi:hypothetical protein
MSDKIRNYNELRALIRVSLRIQNPNWVEPNGDSPLRLGFGTALAIFEVPQLLAAVVAVRLFRPEIVSSSWRCVEQAVSLR